MLFSPADMKECESLPLILLVNFLNVKSPNNPCSCVCVFKDVRPLQESTFRWVLVGRADPWAQEVRCLPVGPAVPVGDRNISKSEEFVADMSSSMLLWMCGEAEMRNADGRKNKNTQKWNQMCSLFSSGPEKSGMIFNYKKVLYGGSRGVLTAEPGSPLSPRGPLLPGAP